MAGSPLKTSKPRLKGWFWFLLGGFILGMSLNLYFSWSPFLWSYNSGQSVNPLVEPENVNLPDPSQTIDVLQVYETPMGDGLRGDPFAVMDKGRLVLETREPETIGAIFEAFKEENRLYYEETGDDALEESLNECNAARTRESTEYHAVAYDRALMRISYFYFYFCGWGTDKLAVLYFPLPWHNTLPVYSRKFARVVGDHLSPAYTGEGLTSNTKDGPWLLFEPEVVTLQGRITYRDYFGPPNYGETPASDALETAAILVLHQSANVGGNAAPFVFPGTRKVQLVLPEGRYPRNDIQGKNVIVEGTLFMRHTGHHRTPVLMTVQDLDVID